MRITEAIKEIGNKKGEGELIKKRVTCAGCGSTWIELVGFVVLQKEGTEDLCLRAGIESENCQTCRYRPLECPQCRSRDVYEIMFAGETSGKTSLCFKRIKRTQMEIP